MATSSSSAAFGRDRIAEALYNWCREHEAFGHVFVQNDFLKAGIIPDNNAATLLQAITTLVKGSLFRVHELKNGGGIGWELVSHEKAANYHGLNQDEHVVFACIDSAGTTGIWTKTIKAKTQVHAKILENTYKTLQNRGLIKPMKSVKFPNRKMFIVASLQPSEEATGGAWFTEGNLDVGLMKTISNVIEAFVSRKSWIEVVEPLKPSSEHNNNKRKQPQDGFDENGKGKSKASKTFDDEQPRDDSSCTKSKAPRIHYEPREPGYEGYPTLREITREIMNSKVAQTILPENAIAQLLDVMVFDDRLVKVVRQANEGESPEDRDTNLITTFRCFKNPSHVRDLRHLEITRESGHASTRKLALRQAELEDVGMGRAAASEIPCLKCPVFDLCGDGGPVNVQTCEYFDPWFERVSNMDATNGKPWTGGAVHLGSPSSPKMSRYGDREARGQPVKIELDER